MRCSGAALCGECCERSCGLGEIACGCGDDAVVIDGCYVGARGGFGGRLRGLSRESACEEECGGWEQKALRVVGMMADAFGGRVTRWRVDVTDRMHGRMKERR